MAMLINRMASYLRKPAHVGERARIAEQAIGFLRRYGLEGSPLRASTQGEHHE
jgi:hypothetical protein